MPDLSALPRLEDLPIPDDVRIDGAWSEVMHHMAAHMGTRAVLALCEKHGGKEVRISAKAVHQFADALTSEERAVFAHAFGGERLAIPVASRAILHAKRAPVLAACRAGQLNRQQVAYILRTPRRHVAALVNQTDEGVGVAPIVLPESRESAAMRRAADAIGVVLSDAGIAADLIAASKARLLGSTSLSPIAATCGDVQ